MHILIVDDEPLARRRIRRQLSVDSDCTVVGEARNGREAVSLIRSLRPDLVFLDVQMPGLNGFEVLKSLGDGDLPMTVFVTAYDQYALQAFKVHAIDYLLKPFDDDEFAESLRRAKDTIRRNRVLTFAEHVAGLLNNGDGRRENRQSGTTPQLTRFAIKQRDRIFFVTASDVDWIEASGKYVVLHLGRNTHTLREPIGRLAGELDPSTFRRIHRSAIVNINRIKELQPWSKGEYRVILVDGTRLTTSRKAYDLLKNL